MELYLIKCNSDYRISLLLLWLLAFDGPAEQKIHILFDF